MPQIEYVVQRVSSRSVPEARGRTVSGRAELRAAQRRTELPPSPLGVLVPRSQYVVSSEELPSV